LLPIFRKHSLTFTDGVAKDANSTRDTSIKTSWLTFYGVRRQHYENIIPLEVQFRRHFPESHVRRSAMVSLFHGALAPRSGAFST